jgi:hypothetical protein
VAKVLLIDALVPLKSLITTGSDFASGRNEYFSLSRQQLAHMRMEWHLARMSPPKTPRGRQK